MWAVKLDPWDSHVGYQAKAEAEMRSCITISLLMGAAKRSQLDSSRLVSFHIEAD